MNITINVNHSEEGSAALVYAGKILLVKQLSEWVVYPALRKILRVLDAAGNFETLAASVTDAERLLAEAEKNPNIQSELPDFLVSCRQNLKGIKDEVAFLQEVRKERSRIGHLFRPTSTFAELSSKLRAERLATLRAAENSDPLTPEEQIADIES
ncbi:hypothetical protein AURDEDRAFT_128713 [Auricularia subglabra TFB-10046 SS5]|nr:hypothetical protein AURDEDRAFT_128713 [Auricularia subglabra TFB-10046 SS5]